MKDVSSIMSFVGELAKLITLLVNAATTKKVKRVAEVLPPELLTTVAKARADLEALEKFGGTRGGA